MEFFYPFFISFFLIFLSELGDKTQLLVLSFSSKLKSYSILLGVALGSFFSHGIAILFGTALGSFENPYIHFLFKLITYFSFIFFGIFTLLQKDEDSNSHSPKDSFLKKLSNLNIGYILMIAFSIAIGELGDKTFLASLGLGINYPSSKLFLILGATLGMVASNSFAILLGKFLTNKVSIKTMNLLSGVLFLIFGIFGFIKFFIHIILY